MYSAESNSRKSDTLFWKVCCVWLILLRFGAILSDEKGEVKSGLFNKMGIHWLDRAEICPSGGVWGIIIFNQTSKEIEAIKRQWFASIILMYCILKSRDWLNWCKVEGLTSTLLPAWMEINKGCSVLGAQLWGPGLPPEPSFLFYLCKFSVQSWFNPFLKSGGWNQLLNLTGLYEHHVEAAVLAMPAVPSNGYNRPKQLLTLFCFVLPAWNLLAPPGDQFGSKGESLLLCAMCRLSLPGNKNEMGFLLDFYHNKRLSPPQCCLDKVGLSTPRFTGNFLHYMDLSDKARSPWQLLY